MAIIKYPAARAKQLVIGSALPCDEGCDFPADIEELRNSSATARAVYDYVANHSTKIHVIFFKQVPKAGDNEVRINGAVFDEAVEFGATIWYNLADKVYNSEAKTKADIKVPRSLVFFHELGHAKQWLENPSRWTAWNDDTTNRVDGYNKPVEEDNLLRHEWPICDEMKPPFPRRTIYPRWCGICEPIKKLKAELAT